jgi:hypothetical protein
MSVSTNSTSSVGFMAFLQPMFERSFAKRVSRELMKLYMIARAGRPDLRGRDLYRRVVRMRLNLDEHKSEALLDEAEESFANWRTPRRLKFLDVVHMIVITEYLELHGNARWIRADLRGVLKAQIPHHL